MPTTRKKVLKTVYKDDESEGETGDFSDSGSDAQISEPPSSDEDIEENVSSAEEFDSKSTTNRQKQPVKRKPKFAKEFIGKINKQSAEIEESEVPLALFSVKDLTDSDKLLPSVLNLSESDSSDDETPKVKKPLAAVPYTIQEQNESDSGHNAEYSDVWGKNIHDNSAEIAKKAFMELEQHKNTIEETKASLQNYVPRSSIEVTKESNVTDLLAIGEEIVAKKSPAKKKAKSKKVKGGSDSELEDWEEVKESKAIPQQGLQLVVELPDSVCRKSKKIDVEMMMKRKINRVKKEHQVFMHKVHVLCWIGHGNYVNRVLNDQDIMAAVLTMVPKGCYPQERLDMKYIEQIVTWYKDKLILKQDKYEHKFKPKAPPLKTILIDQIKGKTVTARKYLVLIFVAMLRALGLQCRIMFNFVTVPLRPPSSELCSLAMKPKDEKNSSNDKKEEKVKPTKLKQISGRCKKTNVKLPQVDGIDDSFMSSDSEFENISQVDGNDDILPRTKSVRSTRAKKLEINNAIENKEDEGASPPKRSKKDADSTTKATKNIRTTKNTKSAKFTETNISNQNKQASVNESNSIKEGKLANMKSPRSLSLKKVVSDDNKLVNDEKDKTIQKSVNPRKNRSNSKTTSDKSTITSVKKDNEIKEAEILPIIKNDKPSASPRKTRSNSKTATEKKHTSTSNVKAITELKKIVSSTRTDKTSSNENNKTAQSEITPPEILVTEENGTQSRFFENSEDKKQKGKISLARKRSHTAVDNRTKMNENKKNDPKAKLRTKSVPATEVDKSKYFDNNEIESKKQKLSVQQLKKQDRLEDKLRVSHRDIKKTNVKPKNDVTSDLVNIIKGRIKGAKEEAKKGIVKGKVKEESSDDSDYLPVEDSKRHTNHNAQESDEDFKPIKISPRPPKLSPGAKPSTSKKHLDRRVLSSDDEAIKIRKVDVWCEIFVEELEQWVAVDVIKGKVHCTGDLYSHASHPVCYVIGWDNNNYLKDLTRRYVPHWNTVTRKQRAEADWWNTAVRPWLGPKNARDREEDEALDRMQLEAPLPKSIAEYKNHPLYALKRHLLKFEAIYPADAATLGFVRNEPVYARECVYTCRSRDTWLKEAKVVKLGEQPYKVVKARPKWDKLSNKLITDKPLEVFGPWQVQDYEPPTAQNGIVPRNAYGNVELFKDCMLPKGTVHIKLPGLNKVARKLNIDCAPAMTGFDFNGGWSHPVYDGFVVCSEFEEIVTDAWVKDQEEQERREREKIELRVYGNWKRLIKGLLIRERLKHKYGFEEPATSQAKGKKGPRLVVKKK